MILKNCKNEALAIQLLYFLPGLFHFHKYLISSLSVVLLIIFQILLFAVCANKTSFQMEYLLNYM